MWACVVVVLALCHLNHARLWIQDLLCSASLYWIPFVFVGLLATLRRIVRERRIPPVVLVVLVAQAFLLYHVFRIARPYVSFARSTVVEQSASTDLSVLYSHVDFSLDGLPTLVKEVSTAKPDLIVLVGEQDGLEVALEALPRYPGVARTPHTSPGGVLVLSGYPLEMDGEAFLGIEALPSVFAKVELPGQALLLGAMDLLPAGSQQDFFRSKVTSRRIATLMRYAEEPRLVIGHFAATQFSPIVSMYTRQVRLRSVMFNHGLLRTFDLTDPLIRVTLDNAFVSRDIQVTDFYPKTGISQRWLSFGFSLRIPRRSREKVTS